MEQLRLCVRLSDLPIELPFKKEHKLNKKRYNKALQNQLFNFAVKLVGQHKKEKNFFRRYHEELEPKKHLFQKPITVGVDMDG